MTRRVLAITVLAVSGLLVSTYLLAAHWGWWQTACFGGDACEVVTQSRWAELFGVPVALLGALTYFAIIALGAIIAQDIYADLARLAQFFLATSGTVFSAYLTYTALFVLRAVCTWCALSAILITFIAILSALELRAAN